MEPSAGLEVSPFTHDLESAVSPPSPAVIADPLRLAALTRTGLLDSLAEEAFDRATRLATTFLGLPVSLVSLVTAERQFFKSQTGLGDGQTHETPLSHSICQYVVSSGEPVVVTDLREHPLLRESGAISDLGVVAYAGVPLRDRDGYVLGAFCVINDEPHDWTDRELTVINDLAAGVIAEIHLRAVADEARARATSLERLAAIVDASQDAIIGKELDGTITHWNLAAQRMYGYTAAEAVGQPISMLAATPEQEGEFELIHARIAAGERIDHYETTRRHRDGYLVAVSVAVAPILDGEGRVVAVSTVASDITARLAAEQERNKLSGLLAEAQQLAGLGSWEIAPTGWTTWTEHLHTLFGLDPDRVHQGDAGPFLALFHPHDREAYLALLDRVRRSGGAEEMQYRIRRGDGAVRVLSTRVRGIEVPEGRRLTGTIIDVTETRALELELIAARDRLADVLDAATETAIIGTGPDGVITVFNRGAERLLGHAAEDVIGIAELTRFHDRDELEARAEELGVRTGLAALVHSARRALPETREWTYLRADGSDLTVSLTITALCAPSGEVTGFLGVAQDISAAREAERARRRAERQFHAAFEHAPIGVVLVGLRGSERGNYIKTNPAFARMLGREPGELDGAAVRTVRSARDRDRSVELFRRLDSGATAVSELIYVHADGREICALVSATPVPADDGEEPQYCVAQILDISERKRFEGQLRHLADHDALTGLFNRHRFEAELERVTGETRRYGRRGALLMLDLDGFKQVNDRFGHPVGDDLVTRVAGLLRRTVRQTDIVARLGGDEFAVILHEAGPTAAEGVAEEILDAVRRYGVIHADDRHARVTTSIGITTFTGSDAPASEELVIEADVAMYDAKAQGRDRCVRYDHGTERRSLRAQRRSWIDRLTTAIDENEFVLHAQPVVGICANGIQRFELLLRLRDEHGTLIPPAAFLSIAERFDIIGVIDRWVLRNAIRLLHEHHAAGNEISLAVNLSGKTMNDDALAGDLAEMLTAHPIPEGRLIIEVTETAAIVNIEHARRLAVALRELGCRFALDDFGAGFASFYYLKHLEFDYLKIDGEFIQALTENPTDQLVVRAVVEIARGLGTKTVAEWVSDDATVELLRELGVDYGQGFHLGMPQPLEAILPALPEVRAPA